MKVHGIFYFVLTMRRINYNGKILDATTPVLTADNRSFKYGDGIFETMKIVQGKIILEGHHFDRLFTSLKLLNIQTESLSKDQLIKEIIELCAINNSLTLARVRLAVYRDNEGGAGYLIEADQLAQQNISWQEEGWAIDIYPHARKPCDAFANLKTASYLCYVLADHYRKEKELDECLLMNTANHICDGSKTNVFFIIQHEIYTPALHQGCINGVMRRFMIDELKKKKFIVKQSEINEALFGQAEEVFLTNAIIGMRWVKNFRNKEYKSAGAKDIYLSIVSDLY